MKFAAEISSLERAVYQRRAAVAIDRLVGLLEAMVRARSVSGILPPEQTALKRCAVYTRIAAAVSSLVSSPEFEPSSGQLDQLASFKPTLEAIFQLSDFGSAMHLLQALGTPNPNGSQTLNGAQIFLICLLLGLDELPEGLLKASLDLPPNLFLVLFAGWLASPFAHSDLGERNRATLINNCSRIEQGLPGEATCDLLNSAWMHCSYATQPNRHRAKKSINVVWRRLAAAKGVKAAWRARRTTSQPTLVVAAERMLSSHAMHRSYGEGIRQLKGRFRTVCLVAKGCLSNDAQDLFDDVVVLPESPAPTEVASALLSLEPDLIYFPSLGMSDWTQVIANFRFAPVQVMTLGHPAPAMTDTIDYSLVQSGHGQAAWEFGEKVIERKAWGQFAPAVQHIPNINTDRETRDTFLHIAVNSGLMKLSSRFLKVCERIEAEAGKPVHFHFFASATGVMFDRLNLTLEQRFKKYTLEPSRDYSSFLESLGRCDLALAAFPFGNTNSTVDTCLLGIPTVAFVANEVLSIGDRDVMRMVGLPAWLVSDNDEDYFQAAMKLIHEDAARQAIVDQLKATDVKAKLFQPSRPEDATEFADAFWWIYQHHEALQASSQHLIKVGEPIPA
ncbi:MAG: hypothetical protein ACK5O3_00855 [Burkholderiales bacterium]|jgi:hypothetical protein